MIIILISPLHNIYFGCSLESSPCQWHSNEKNLQHYFDAKISEMGE